LLSAAAASTRACNFDRVPETQRVMSSIESLNEAELEEQFVRSSGPGGQNVNKVSTKVLLRHIPTNLMVTVQEGRSQAANRRLARERLLDLLRQREQKAKAELRDRRELLRRQTRPRPSGLKRSILEDKKKRSKLKSQRQTRFED
jgi:protein subunit release factor B